MNGPSKPPDKAQDMLDAALDAEASRRRLLARAFDAVDAAEAISAGSRGAKGGGKLSRSETVTVRLDPKLRYLAELAARLHRRTLSSYVEWAIEASLDNNVLKPDFNGQGVSIKDDAEFLWDVDEADRFARLALRYPHLLSHEEQVRWKLIRECPGLWRGRYTGKNETWTWSVSEESLVFETLRSHWTALCAVADGTAAADTLPKWLMDKSNSAAGRRAPPSKPPTGFDDMDDDIPF